MGLTINPKRVQSNPRQLRDVPFTPETTPAFDHGSMSEAQEKTDATVLPLRKPDPGHGTAHQGGHEPSGSKMRTVARTDRGQDERNRRDGRIPSEQERPGAFPGRVGKVAQPGRTGLRAEP